MCRLRSLLFFVIFPVIIISGCESLKSSRAILPIKEYELMIAGRLDANYVGTTNCLAACHFHDKIRRDFEASTMGVQLSRKSGMPLVDCESCHGPGSLAIEGLTPEKVELDAREGKQTSCDFRTLIDIRNLPAQARSLICLKCHTANATFNLHNWNASAHSLGDVSCSECHKVHAGPDLTVRLKDMVSMCENCHRDVQAEFALPSHHPIHEKRIFCVSCHDPHGTTSNRMLRKEGVKETCTQCHAEKEGPFVFEHADTMEDCGTCHRPHGSVNNNLLTQQPPFLCLQCHTGHKTSSTSSAESKGAFYTRCTDCHSQIHGSDIPSPVGRRRFIQ